MNDPYAIISPVKVKSYLHKFKQGIVVVIYPENWGECDNTVKRHQYVVNGEVEDIGHVLGFTVDAKTNEVLVSVRLATGLIEAFHPDSLYLPE